MRLIEMIKRSLVWRQSIQLMLICSFITLLWHFWPRTEPVGEVFVLRSAWVGWLFNTVIVFFLVSIPSCIYRFGLSRLKMRPFIKRIGLLVSVLPLLFTGFWLEFGRFDKVIVGEEKISLRGSSPFSECEFCGESLGVVFIRKQDILTDLVFKWYDEVHQSVWIVPFDNPSKRRLSALIAEMEQQGIAVSDGEPEGELSLPIFQ